MKPIIRVHVNLTSYLHATGLILDWSARRESRYVCAANVHMLMEAWDAPDFREVVNAADLVTPDGMPLVWMLRLKGQRGQTRVYGPTLMLHILEAAAHDNVPVGFYGGAPEVLETLVNRMTAQYPGLTVPFVHSPPFGEVSPAEDEALIQKINGSGARILFVGLGCPKQERWMAAHRGRVAAVMIGVGAAFDFHAGAKRQSPAWMQRLGLEWLFRLMVEPRRLWRRYLFNNPRFILLAILDLLGLLDGKPS